MFTIAPLRLSALDMRSCVIFMLPPVITCARLPPVNSTVPALVTAPPMLSAEVINVPVWISIACPIVALFVTAPVIVVLPPPEILLALVPPVKVNNELFTIPFVDVIFEAFVIRLPV